jgi:hypothetical protein
MVSAAVSKTRQSTPYSGASTTLKKMRVDVVSPTPLNCAVSAVSAFRPLGTTNAVIPNNHSMAVLMSGYKDY